ncbi:MAG: hypothetical protein GY829_07190 [Gammaproteobacteria bacterium]|nr:hypothetical protein [Gammaproteobacteria bacterium]
MRFSSIIISLIFSFSVFFLSACNENNDTTIQTSEHYQPKAIDSSHECAICGMYIANQPAPRAQILHRNGEHAFFCSIGDMLTYHQIPSPLGKPVKIWVETLDKETNPLISDIEQHQWTDHKNASYLTKINRRMVMGYPVVALQSKSDSIQMQKEYGGELSTWDSLVKQHRESMTGQVSNMHIKKKL